MTGNSDVGGVVGNTTHTISKCFSKGSVISSGSAGGIVAFGRCIECYSEASVSGVDHVGGIVGFGSATYCHATGIVSGNDYVGGIIGWVGLEYQNNLYFAGSVSGSTNVGALVGGAAFSAFTVFDSYFLDTSGPDNGYGSSQTIDEMYLQSTYAGWDFVNTWKILNGIALPKFIWQNDDVELDLNGAVIFGDRDTDGSWCIKRDQGDLVFAKRIGGVWVVSETIGT